MKEGKRIREPKTKEPNTHLELKVAACLLFFHAWMHSLFRSLALYVWLGIMEAQRRLGKVHAKDWRSESLGGLDAWRWVLFLGARYTLKQVILDCFGG